MPPKFRKQPRQGLLRLVCGLIVCAAACLSSMTTGGFVQQFGEKVRALRLKRGLSQEALAHAAGLHRTHISLIERGRRSVRLETIEALAQALQVQPSRLMPKL